MKRTILYYPTISISDGEWLRQAVFYYDEVASIVPQRITLSGESKGPVVPLAPEVEFLRSEGIYRPITPDSLWMKRQDRVDWTEAHQLGDQFRAAVTEGFRGVPTGARFVRVHRDKIGETLIVFLRDMGLLKYDAPDDRWYEAEWYLIEEKTALLYMGMLAQFLADIDEQATVPGTDRREYENLIFAARKPESGVVSTSAYLRSVLPVPRADVSFADILAFKRRREAELLNYRAQIDQLLQRLAKAETPAAVKEVLVGFDEKQRREVDVLTRVLGEAKVTTFWGSLKALVGVKSPTLWGAVAGAFGVGAGVVSWPITLGGVVVAGAIEVGSYLVDQRNKKRATERENEFALIHHGRAEGIL